MRGERDRAKRRGQALSKMWIKASLSRKRNQHTTATKKQMGREQQRSIGGEGGRRSEQGEGGGGRRRREEEEEGRRRNEQVYIAHFVFKNAPLAVYQRPGTCKVVHKYHVLEAELVLPVPLLAVAAPFLPNYGLSSRCKEQLIEDVAVPRVVHPIDGSECWRDRQ